MVAHVIWDDGERFKSYIFYVLLADLVMHQIVILGHVGSKPIQHRIEVTKPVKNRNDKFHVRWLYNSTLLLAWNINFYHLVKPTKSLETTVLRHLVFFAKS